MESTLQGLEVFTLVYLDDMLVFSETEEQHRLDVRPVVQRFQDEKMKVKFSKSEFTKKEI